MIRSKSVFLLSCLFLFGCGNDENSVPPSEQLPLPTKNINIYTAPDYAGHFGRAFMLSSAFSSNASDTIISLGVNGNLPFDYKSLSGADYKLIKLERDINKLNQIILTSTNDKLVNNLFIDAGSVFKNPNILTNETLNSLDNIFIVPEGTSFLGAEKAVIDNIVLFAKKAKDNGVKNIKLILWDSIDRTTILNSSSQISRLPENGVDYEFINFNNMSRKINNLKTSDGLLSAAIYAGSINPSITEHKIFIQNQNFDKNKDSIVLFGSYTRNEINTSKTNQIDILKKLEKTVDHKKYNLLFKGHPSEVSVNDWIHDNPNLSSASYFKSFPYEIWQVVGGGEHKFSYNDVSHNLFLPKVPTYIYSMFSTTLYGEDANKIKVILGYNKVRLVDGEYILTNEIDGSANEDRMEYNRWVDWTKNSNVPFKMTYSWINDLK